MAWYGDDDIARATEALVSRVPARLAVLARLAFNYRWSWLPGGGDLFRAVDPYVWSQRRQNPVRLLREAPPDSLARAAANQDLVDRAAAAYDAVHADLFRPFSRPWRDRPVAFLCAEFGLHRSLPIYSGGLGVLAGDILKEASDAAIPLVAIGILYRQGNFHQRLDPSGWQHEYWIESDPYRLPAALVTRPDGSPLTVSVPLLGREVVLQIWRTDVGRTPLYLLDASRPENSRLDRWITARLYDGDRTIRLAQYTVLGVGGMRALAAMGIDPSVVHLNEGHAAMAPLELARESVANGLTFEKAVQEARARTVFTTHTPVPAGNETYTAQEVLDVLDDFRKELAVEATDLLNLGRHRAEEFEPVGATVLAIRMSRRTNGVSRRHGEVARDMWRHLFVGGAEGGEAPDAAVPIGHVTNAVHLPSWMGRPMRELLARHLGHDWERRAAEPDTWRAVEGIPDAELWAVRNEMRTELVGYARDHAVADRLARGDEYDYAEAATRLFDPGILTIGFARRVAAYKRLPLLIRDPERVGRLVRGERGVQIVLGGKAHPQDEEAKRILQGLFALKLEESLDGRLVFLEDYDMGMAFHLVQGCDVWINVPRPPLEASGTSGMKSALNGGINVSVLDGWWDEAFDGSNGWAIRGDRAFDIASQDARDAAALYDILEHEVLPEFYGRDPSGVPVRWVQRIKASLRTIGPRYCAGRMLRDYAERVYELS